MVLLFTYPLQSNLLSQFLSFNLFYVPSPSTGSLLKAIIYRTLRVRLVVIFDSFKFMGLISLPSISDLLWAEVWLILIQCWLRYYIWKHINLIVSNNGRILAYGSHLYRLIKFRLRTAHFQRLTWLVSIHLSVVKLHWLARITGRWLCKLCSLLRLALLQILNLLHHKILLFLPQLAQNILALLLLILNALKRKLLFFDTDEALDCI